ncbi:UNVERIFIED_CONTAM: hypothetical protein HDU68_011997 [Siphonaria sp. JEL0065]|nr:hypothetical protein HDU68_011997 [Siphonaria sp. JEL0065]
MKLEFTFVVALAVAAVSAAPLPFLGKHLPIGHAQRAQMDGKADGHTKSGHTDIAIDTKRDGKDYLVDKPFDTRDMQERAIDHGKSDDHTKPAGHIDITNNTKRDGKAPPNHKAYPMDTRGAAKRAIDWDGEVIKEADDRFKAKEHAIAN